MSIGGASASGVGRVFEAGAVTAEDVASAGTAAGVEAAVVAPVIARGASAGTSRASVLAGLAAGAPAVDPARVAKDVEAIEQALRGPGTDEDAVYAILEGRSPVELRAIEAAFDQRYARAWGSLRLALQEEMSGDELARALGPLERAESAEPGAVTITPESRRDADALHRALRGGGTDEAAVYKVLEGRNDAEILAIEAAFAERYGSLWYTLRMALHDDLSGAELERALRPLDRAAPPVGTEAFDRLLDAETRSLARAGSSASMLFDGVQSFEKRYALIEKAESSIHLQTFIFNDDETGWKTARALAEASRRGVAVRLVYDPLGSHLTKPEIFDFLRAAGVEVRAANDPWKDPTTLNTRWHEKILIVDGKDGITGGMNVGDEYAYGGSARPSIRSRDGSVDRPWRDTDIHVAGPVVQDLQRAFVRNWESLGGRVDRPPQAALFPPLGAAPGAGGTNVRFVQHRPIEDGDRFGSALYLRAIAGARDRILIESAYFLPPPEIKEALIAAARRGVRIEVMTNARSVNDMPIVTDASRYDYEELLAAGIRIHEKGDRTLHSKTATIDGALSIVGSMNLNGRSDGQDTESVAVVTGPEVAKANEARFAAGLSGSNQVTAADVEREGPLDDLIQLVLQPFRWMI